MKFTALMFLMIAGMANADTITLNPMPNAKLLGGVSCGGQHVSTYATGFDVDDNVTGLIYAWTRCNVSGRGWRTKLYEGWYSITWDVSGAALSQVTADAATPDPDAVFEYDGYTAFTAIFPISSSTYQAMLNRP